MKTFSKTARVARPEQKPVVHYSHVSGLRVGHSAYVQPIDHTGPSVTNSTVVVTSTVLRHERHTGEFETLNSVYRRQMDQGQAEK